MSIRSPSRPARSVLNRTVVGLAGLALASVASAALVPPVLAQAAALSGPAAPDPVVFSTFPIPDGDQPAIEAGVWRPSGPSDAPRPLILISHGTGGDFRSHEATAQALARAGFVVAALTHTGDNWRDQSRATDLAGRTRQISVVLDYLLTRWDGRAGLDPERIGAFGYSAGGFTLLAAAGGNPDLSRIAPHCQAHPEAFDCRLVAQHPPPAGTAGADGIVVHHDPRLKALVIAAPALGFTFAGSGLAAVTQPVQLWQAGADQILPAPDYAEPVRDALPNPPTFFRVEGAGHFDFMPPCSAQLKIFAPAICAPTPGFDRAAFHARFNPALIAFYRLHLAAPAAAGGGSASASGPAAVSPGRDRAS
ncbi:MAG: alpha/beta hydrolase family protein [Phenylobacterium sp.]